MRRWDENKLNSFRNTSDPPRSICRQCQCVTGADSLNQVRGAACDKISIHVRTTFPVCAFSRSLRCNYQLSVLYLGTHMDAYCISLKRGRSLQHKQRTNQTDRRDHKSMAMSPNTTSRRLTKPTITEGSSRSRPL
jgi:hypothetical protein